MIDKQQDFLTLTGAARRARSEGYDITYNEYNDIFRIPNKEVSQEYVNALSTMNWHGVTASDIQKIANT